MSTLPILERKGGGDGTGISPSAKALDLGKGFGTLGGGMGVWWWQTGVEVKVGDGW